MRRSLIDSLVLTSIESGGLANRRRLERASIEPGRLVVKELEL